jgi:hypothetical protein
MMASGVARSRPRRHAARRGWGSAWRSARARSRQPQPVWRRAAAWPSVPPRGRGTARRPARCWACPASARATAEAMARGEGARTQRACGVAWPHAIRGCCACAMHRGRSKPSRAPTADAVPLPPLGERAMSAASGGLPPGRALLACKAQEPESTGLWALGSVLGHPAAGPSPASTAQSAVDATAAGRRAGHHRRKSVGREICTRRSVGAGGG